MAEQMRDLSEWVGGLLELLGILVILGGVLVSTVRLVREAVRAGAFEGTYEPYRTSVARSILLGLEFLVAADIVGTVAVAPTFRNVGVLAGIVAIRTFLSFSLELEISGRWPWQRRDPQ